MKRAFHSRSSSVMPPMEASGDTRQSVRIVPSSLPGFKAAHHIDDRGLAGATRRENAHRLFSSMRNEERGQDHLALRPGPERLGYIVEFDHPTRLIHVPRGWHVETPPREASPSGTGRTGRRNEVTSHHAQSMVEIS